MASAGQTTPWAGVDRLIDRTASWDALRVHRLQLLAGRRRRDLGLPVPEAIAAEERRASLRTVLAPLVLERVRACVSGPLVLMKGPEAAARYLHPTLRPFGDVDLLVEDARRVQRELLEAGFVRAGLEDAYYEGRQHLTPLVWPRAPIAIEIHRRPEWPAWAAAPDVGEIIAAAVPSATGVDGISAPSPAWHAVLLAAHAWAEAPLRRLLDLVDAAALSTEADRDDIAALAARCDVGGVWDTTIGAADALFAGGPTPWSLRLWGRNLAEARDRTVFESHVARLCGPAWLRRPRPALRAAAHAVAAEVRPAAGESWRLKRERTRRAIRNRSLGVAEHNAATE